MIKETFLKYEKSIMANGAIVATGLSTMGLAVSSTGVSIEAGDLSTITDANSAYLSSAFQIVELLPYIAVLAGGFFVLNKLFGIIPKAGGQ